GEAVAQGLIGLGGGELRQLAPEPGDGPQVLVADIHAPLLHVAQGPRKSRYSLGGTRSSESQGSASRRRMRSSMAGESGGKIAVWAMALRRSACRPRKRKTTRVATGRRAPPIGVSTQTPLSTPTSER